MAIGLCGQSGMSLVGALGFPSPLWGGVRGGGMQPTTIGQGWVGYASVATG